MTANPASHEVLTPSAEDYLKAIYRLTAPGRPAGTNELAEALELAPASVSGMLRRLAEQGLVEHEPYKGVVLSREGKLIALRMVRRHRIIEAFLVAQLGYTWDTVHDEAERLEHAVSDTLIERMAGVLGDPRVDPHGDPIPGPDGTIAELVYVPLTEIDVGEQAEIQRVASDLPEKLRYIGANGLVPGTHIRVTRREPFQGPITLRVGRKEQVIGWELARELLCRRVG